MSKSSDFVIENDVLKKYVGPGGDVVIPEGVTSIGSSAFSGCSSLTSVTIPASVTSIGYRAFSNCNRLVSATIPSSVISIGCFAFEGTVPYYRWARDVHNEALYIGNCLIQSKSYLSGTYQVKEGTRCISALAFSGCRSLKGVVIPESVMNIGDCAFSGCSSLMDLSISGKNTKLKKDVFGYDESLPKGLIKQIGKLYPFMEDGALKQYVLEKKTWNKLVPALREEIFLTRQGKALEPVYLKRISYEDLGPLGKTIMQRLQVAKPAMKDFTAAAAYMTLFYEAASVDMLNALYSRLKEIKGASKAVKKIEEHVALMDKLGKVIEIDASLSSVAQKVMADLLAQKKSAQNMENDLQDYYGLTYKELPIVFETDGTAAEPLVFAWLLTAHETVETRELVPAYEKPGQRPEAEEIVALLDPVSLQAALMKLADEHLVAYQNTKKKYLSYPFCRYADEAAMMELTKRAPKWRTSVSGDNAPPLRILRDAAKYSSTRAAMLFAERYHELDKYAALRRMTEDELRDKYLSDVGLDERGGKAYDLGNQTITVRLQKDLSFLIELPDGKTAKSLPKRNADPAKYEAANKDFSETKKSVKKILSNRGKVLLKDFLSGRRRSASDWTGAYLSNPLLREAASLVVWAQGKKTFTVRDGVLIDNAEQPYVITNQPIRVAHPMEMTAADTEAWQKYFASHALKQPFAQVWEPVRKPDEICPDRYKGCEIALYRFLGQEKHGIHANYYGYEGPFWKHWHFTTCSVTFEDCKGSAEMIAAPMDHYDYSATVSSDEKYKIESLSFEKYTRQVNHIISYLDRVTVWDRVCKDDVSVMEYAGGFTLAQITEFIRIAQESSAVNVLAQLLEYKNAHFADFDPMDEFTLEW